MVYRMLLAALLISLPLAGPVSAAQGDALDQSWSASHWGVVGVYGDASTTRSAFVVDRDSVRSDPVSGRREFNWLIVLERRPERTGSMVRQWVDCKKRVSGNLLSANYDRGARMDDKVSTEGQPFRPDSELYKALHAVCTGDWSGLTLLDAPAKDLSLRAFGP